MARAQLLRFGLTGVLATLLGCPNPPVTEDASLGDAGPDAPLDASSDAGPPVPASTDHCDYTPLPATAGAGQTVTSGVLTAGVAEGRLNVPVSVTLGAYTGRAENVPGSEGYIDARREPIAGGFATSVGIETRPRIRVLALTTGQASASTADDETVILIKTDLGVGYQGLVHEVEARLGPAYAGKVIITTSHSHSSFANYQGHGGMQVGFGAFRRGIFDQMVDDLVETTQRALAARVPARMGIGVDNDFDPTDQVSRDRRRENDIYAGGPEKDNHLFVIRVDRADGSPMAVLPMFGIHGTIHGAANMLASTESTGGIERVLEERFPGEQVTVMHLQGAGGDVSPVGLDATECGPDQPLCTDFAREESLGHRAADEILAAWELAGDNMVDDLAIEAISRSIERGPNWENFTVRGGALSYAPFDGRRVADGLVFNDADELISPIDEFNAPFGAALCGQDLPAVIRGAQLPGTAGLTTTSYRSCHQLIDRSAAFFETLLDITIGTTPICDTTRTTISAVRFEAPGAFGRYVISTIPGEPITLLADVMRERAEARGMDPERLMILGYTQDNNGYVMTAEDWLALGYEPSITFWGPLDGEMIMERAVDLLDAAISPMRENGYEGGTRVAVPNPTELFTPDESTVAGSRAGDIPAASPAYLTTRSGPLNIPTQLAEGASVPRLSTVHFTWVGGHPFNGTPEVRIEQQVGAEWVPLTRQSGRVVDDAEFLLTWTPDPLLAPAPGAPGRVHYWTVEWQAVAPLGWDSTDTMADRLTLPAGRYRFHVTVPDTGYIGRTEYEVTREFVIAPAPLQVEATRTGGNATITVTAHAPQGFRLLDLEAGATRRFPLRNATVSVVVGGGAAATVTLDASGQATFPAAAGAIAVTDASGNTGTSS